MFIKNLPASAESVLNQRSTMTHETNDKADDDPDDQETSTCEANNLRINFAEGATSDKTGDTQVTPTDTTSTDERKEPHSIHRWFRVPQGTWSVLIPEPCLVLEDPIFDTHRGFTGKSLLCPS